MIPCYACGASLAEVPLPLSRHEYCPGCGTELHCCRMCRHYDSGRANDCTEGRAEPPSNKEGANFCDWFAPKDGAGASSKHRNDDARAKLEALFSNEPPDKR